MSDYTVRAKRQGKKITGYGVFKDGQHYQNLVLHNQSRAQLVAEYLRMIDSYILDKENGYAAIRDILRLDKNKHHAG